MSLTYFHFSACNGPGLTIVHYAMLSLDMHTVCIVQRSGIIIMGLNTLRLRYSDQKNRDINGHNKEFLNNYSSYTFLL